jgi:hypothetical protein
MYIDHVMQACHGADLDFLIGCRGARVTREAHYVREVISNPQTTRHDL